MKILFVCYFYLPHVGGLNSYVETLRKELEENGHQVDILAHHPDMRRIYKYQYTKSTFGWKVTGTDVDKAVIKNSLYNQVFYYYDEYLPYVKPWIRWREIERYMFELAAASLDLSQYDLIHTQDIVSTRALWRVKPRHIPLVATIHGILATEHIHAGDIQNQSELAWKYVAQEEYYGHVSAHQTIVPTRWQLQQLSQHYRVPASQINVIPYGLDLKEIQRKMRNNPYPPVQRGDEHVIACVARLVPEKNLQLLLRALKIVKQKRQSFSLWLIGDGKLRYELERLCKELQIMDHVKFMGNRFDIPALLNIADSFVLPSKQDMHPYSLMEAQVVGRAIVASNAGGIPEMVKHGETGLIFELSNHEQLAQHLLTIMSNATLRKKLENTARTWAAKEWSAKTLYARTIKIYQRAIAEAGKSGTELEAGQPDRALGLIKDWNRPKRMGEDLFQFEAEYALFQAKVWNPLVKSVPPDYSIPDPVFIQTLVQRRSTSN